MNSRGKKLTEYEIFKSLLLKHIEKDLCNKELKTDMAIKFDNKWTDLVWESIGRPEAEADLIKIDVAYVNLMKLLLKILSYKQDKGVKGEIKLSEENLKNYLSTNDSVEYIRNILDVLVWAKEKFNSVDEAFELLRTNMTPSGTITLKVFGKKTNPFNSCLTGEKNVTNAELLYLVAYHTALGQLKTCAENGTSVEEFETLTTTLSIRLRHLRNLIENSEYEIRDDNMPLLIKETENVMNGILVTKDKADVVFNTNQWYEECGKVGHETRWATFWNVEEHEYLRGALSLFYVSSDNPYSTDEDYNALKHRLENFEYIFDEEKRNNDHIIRAALLTYGDYSQYLGNDSKSRILGNTPMGWRNMFVNTDRRKNQKTVIEIIGNLNDHSKNVSTNLHEIVDNYVNSATTDKTDWKYYAVKYRGHTYKAYTHRDTYGYYYIETKDNNTLESAVLQSSQYFTDNVAWYLLNVILAERNESKYHLSLGFHKGDKISLKLGTKNVSLCITSKGWQLIGLDEQELSNAGIGYEAIKESEDETAMSLFFVKPDGNEDYIEFAEEYILKPLGNIYTAFNIK